MLRKLIAKFKGKKMLNNGRKKVELIGITAPSQPQLQFGYVHPSNTEKRTESLRQSNLLPGSPRLSSEHNILQPAPIREQTVWSTRVSPNLQRQLRSGFSSQQNFGRQSKQINNNIMVAVGASISSEHQRFTTTIAPNIYGQLALRTISHV